MNCYGEATGAITLSVSGGMAPYQFAWSNGARDQNLFDLVAGSYQVSITDANGCSIENEFTVNEPAALEAIETITDVNCYGEATGAITLAVTGGTEPYEFAWSNGEAPGI